MVCMMKKAINIQPGGAGEGDCVPVTERDAASLVFRADLSRLIRALRNADLVESEKADGLAKLAEFLKTPAAVTLLHEGISELLGEMEIEWGVEV